MSDRPFRVLGIQQIAVGGLDKGRLRKLWIDTLGLTVTGTFQSERENVDEDIAVAGSGPLKVEVDLMQPIDADKKPAVHNPPLNHIGLWIDDLHAAVAWLEKQGVRFTPGGIRKGAAGFDVTFIHPKENDQFPIGGEGVLIELVQAPAEVIAAFAKVASLLNRDATGRRSRRRPRDRSHPAGDARSCGRSRPASIGVELGLYLTHSSSAPRAIGAVVGAGLVGAALAALLATLGGRPPRAPPHACSR